MSRITTMSWGLRCRPCEKSPAAQAAPQKRFITCGKMSDWENSQASQWIPPGCACVFWDRKPWKMMVNHPIGAGIHIGLWFCGLHIERVTG